MSLINFLRGARGQIAPDVPVTEKPSLFDKTFRFIALDVETANSDSSSICQIGLACVPVQGPVMSLGTLIDPETHFDSFNVNLHGIDAVRVQGQPNFEWFLSGFQELLSRQPLVQHSAFDKRAIESACHAYGLSVPDLTWHDSVTMARRAWPEFKGNGGHGLANLKVELGLEFQHHDAEEDARAAAQVVLLAEERTGLTLQDLAAPKRKASRKFLATPSLEGRQDGPLHGHVACFTGSLSMSRTDAAKLAADAGVTVRNTVSGKTTLLVVGDQDLTLLNGHDKSSKHRRAEELSLQGQKIGIITESTFLAMLNS
ncbi:exonuclease domain-containing protein [Shimia abyssi]|nr:exonuclease domain-containing protein [Shimia abyssi]